MEPSEQAKEAASKLYTDCWNVKGVFPSLEDTLSVMAKALDEFARMAVEAERERIVTELKARQQVARQQYKEVGSREGRMSWAMGATAYGNSISVVNNED